MKRCVVCGSPEKPGYRSWVESFSDWLCWDCWLWALRMIREGVFGVVE